MLKKISFWFGLLAVVLLVVIFFNLKEQSKIINPVLEQPTEKVQPKNPSEVTIFPADPVRGVKNGAKLTIVQFSDFTCPYCAQMAVLLSVMVAQNKDRVSLVWKDFPLAEHEQSLPAAKAAQCASLQGKFWDYHDKLFQNQSSLSDFVYESIANDLKLNMPKFLTCLSNNETLPLIQRNIMEGRSVGLDGTPYYIINGRVHSGILTQTELNDLLSGY
ncbi:thioredoxin domain-containing protein [Patescibacteria group bacterium]|nr:thioredoxin domain-containing protein [Patescibacteria group bacterium]